MALKAKKLEVKENGKEGAEKKGTAQGPNRPYGPCGCASWAGNK